MGRSIIIEYHTESLLNCVSVNVKWPRIDMIDAQMQTVTIGSYEMSSKFETMIPNTFSCF